MYDLLVIGNDPEGLEYAVAASRLGQRTAIILDREMPPSVEALAKGAEAAIQRHETTMKGWRLEVQRLVMHLNRLRDAQMQALGIEQLAGKARLIAPTTVEIGDESDNQFASAAKIVIACGTISRQPASFQIDGRRVVVAESLLAMDQIPRSALVVGGGTTGQTVAMTLAKLGVEVTIVDEHLNLFDLTQMFDDSFDLIQSLQIAYRLGEEVIGTELIGQRQPAIRLASGRILRADSIVICVGREGNTQGLNLEAFNVGLDERGRVWSDAGGQTWSPQILAVGDVVGFPGRNDRKLQLTRE